MVNFSSYRPTTKFDEPIGGRMPPNAWGPVSPQSHGPSSQAGAQGFGANPPAKGGGMETSSVAVILFYIVHTSYISMGLILNETMVMAKILLFFPILCFFRLVFWEKQVGRLVDINRILPQHHHNRYPQHRFLSIPSVSLSDQLVELLKCLVKLC